MAYLHRVGGRDGGRRGLKCYPQTGIDIILS